MVDSINIPNVNGRYSERAPNLLRCLKPSLGENHLPRVDCARVHTTFSVVLATRRSRKRRGRGRSRRCNAAYTVQTAPCVSAGGCRTRGSPLSLQPSCRMNPASPRCRVNETRRRGLHGGIQVPLSTFPQHCWTLRGLTRMKGVHPPLATILYCLRVLAPDTRCTCNGQYVSIIACSRRYTLHLQLPSFTLSRACAVTRCTCNYPLLLSSRTRADTRCTCNGQYVSIIACSRRYTC